MTAGRGGGVCILESACHNDSDLSSEAPEHQGCCLLRCKGMANTTQEKAVLFEGRKEMVYGTDILVDAAILMVF